MKKIAVLFLLILIITFSCKPNKDNEQKDLIIFKGILNTDGGGNILSGDNTDWRLTDTLNQRESSLFSIDKDNHCISNLNSFSIIAFPNPCTTVFQLASQFPDGYTLSIRMVDRYYKILFSLDSTIAKNISFAPSYFKITNDTVRIYYKFIGDNCELDGHGDIKVNLPL